MGNNKIPIPYSSKKMGLASKYFGHAFTLLSSVFVVVFISILTYFVMIEDGFKLLLPLYYIVATLFLILVYIGFYDYRNNCTEYELRDTGIILFGKHIPWKNIRKIFKPFSNSKLISIDFQIDSKHYRALIINDSFMKNSIKDFIVGKTKNSDNLFNTNSCLTLRDFIKINPPPTQSR